MDNLDKISKQSLSVTEQETNINFMRDEEFAKIYTSDSTMITKLDKLCKDAPKMYKLDYETPVGKAYICKDKSLISFRSKKRELTDEQKEAAGKRMRKYQASKIV